MIDTQRERRFRLLAYLTEHRHASNKTAAKALGTSSSVIHSDLAALEALGYLRRVRRPGTRLQGTLVLLETTEQPT